MYPWLQTRLASQSAGIKGMGQHARHIYSLIFNVLLFQIFFKGYPDTVIEFDILKKICVCVCCAMCTCGSQKTVCGSHFSTMWVTSAFAFFPSQPFHLPTLAPFYFESGLRLVLLPSLTHCLSAFTSSVVGIEQIVPGSKLLFLELFNFKVFYLIFIFILHV